MKNKIAFRLWLYFSAALLLFSLIIGAVFIVLFRDQTKKENQDDLKTRAISIAGALSEYMGGDTDSGGRGAMGGGTGGYGAYLRLIDDIAMADVWVVDEDLNLIMDSRMPGSAYHYTDLPADADEVVTAVFQGETTFSESFSSLLNAPTLTVGTPISVDGTVVGAVLLHASIEGMDEATTRGIGILGVSLLSALLLSVLLSVFLALSFTGPLGRMKRAALLLAGGDYTAKTGVRQSDEIGELAGAIDILSERLQAAKGESEKLDQLRRDFVANISHELKTPVTVIRGSLEALCDDVVTSPAQVKDYYRQMLSESLSLQRLVSDLLDLSKLQNADFRMEMQEQSLCDILRDAARSASRLAQQKQVEIRQMFDTESLAVLGDYDRLRQMFLIVLDNAVKFSPPGAAVELSLTEKTVSIRDHGCGIAEEDLPHIFDRFYKVKSEENKSGSGLGLAIARQIADRHNVAVSVTSRLGEGTEFRFQF
ncbi:MAG TPA: HAMP domain-containing sensor histidine kinase [Oscillospiraceae bacterium]|nr:HAMP domain-containing sensor histidine kinase [Oscillospiraceae bacterium]